MAGALYALFLLALAAWAFSAGPAAPVRSPYLLLLGVPCLGGTLAWSGVALLRGSRGAAVAATLAAGAAGALVLFVFALDLTWRWQNPTAVVTGPPLKIWPVVIFLAWPAAQQVLVRVAHATPVRRPPS